MLQGVLFNLFVLFAPVTSVQNKDNPFQSEKKKNIQNTRLINKEILAEFCQCFFVFEFNHSEHFARHVVIWNAAVKYLHVSVNYYQNICMRLFNPKHPKHRAFYVICGTNKETLLSLIKCAPPGIDREQADEKWKCACCVRFGIIIGSLDVSVSRIK